MKAWSPINVTLLGMVSEVRLEQLWKELLPSDVTLLGIVIDVRPEQPEKVPSPIDVTLLGIFTEVRPEQPEKALPPIDVTLLGMVSEVRPEQPEKALPAIPNVPSCNVIDVFSGIVPIYLYATLPAYIKPSGWLLYHAVPENAVSSIDVTLIGIVISVRLEQL